MSTATIQLDAQAVHYANLLDDPFCALSDASKTDVRALLQRAVDAITAGELDRARRLLDNVWVGLEG